MYFKNPIDAISHTPLMEMARMRADKKVRSRTKDITRIKEAIKLLKGEPIRLEFLEEILAA